MRVAVVVAECAAQPLFPLYSFGLLGFDGARRQQLIAEPLMVSLCMIQLDNEIPILAKHERCITHGIRGEVAVCRWTKQSRRMGVYSFDAMLKRHCICAWRIPKFVDSRAITVQVLFSVTECYAFPSH